MVDQYFQQVIHYNVQCTLPHLYQHHSTSWSVFPNGIAVWFDIPQHIIGHLRDRKGKRICLSVSKITQKCMHGFG